MNTSASIKSKNFMNRVQLFQKCWKEVCAVFDMFFYFPILECLQ